MFRTQIELTEEQATALREIAAVEGRSIEDVVRESVDAYAASRKPRDQRNRQELRAAALAVAGRFRSGFADLGTRHDDYLSEDFE